MASLDTNNKGISFNLSLFFFYWSLFKTCFWLHWVFIAARGLSLVVVSGGSLVLQGPLILLASLVVEHGLWMRRAAVAAAHRHAAPGL